MRSATVSSIAYDRKSAPESETLIAVLVQVHRDGGRKLIHGAALKHLW